MKMPLQNAAEDYPAFRRWIAENCERASSKDWDSPVSNYLAYRFHGFLFNVWTWKETQVEDHIWILREALPSDDKQEDRYVACIYNLNAPGTKQLTHFLVEDTELLKFLEKAITAYELGKELQANLTSEKSGYPKSQHRKI